MIDRIFQNTGQLITTAPDPATAQDQMEQATAAIRTALALLPGISIAFEPEVENGLYVLQES